MDIKQEEKLKKATTILLGGFFFFVALESFPLFEYPKACTFSHTA